MKFTLAAASLALAAGVSAVSNSTGDVYVTEVVTAYTTYCPAATSVVHNGQTYTVSEATTLTITNCPCTITYPASSSAAVSTAVFSNGTASAGTISAAATTNGTSVTSATLSTYTGAAALPTFGAGVFAAAGALAMAML